MDCAEACGFTTQEQQLGLMGMTVGQGVLVRTLSSASDPESAWLLERRGSDMTSLAFVAKRDGRPTLPAGWPSGHEGEPRRETALRSVLTDKNGLRAVVASAFGDLSLNWFDTLCDHAALGAASDRATVALRAWAVWLRSSSSEPIRLKAEEMNWDPNEISPGSVDADGCFTVHTKGGAMLFPAEADGAPVYDVRGPVKKIEAMPGGYRRLTVTAARPGGDDFDVPVWLLPDNRHGDDGPSLGQDVEGLVWMQGVIVDAAKP